MDEGGERKKILKKEETESESVWGTNEATRRRSTMKKTTDVDWTVKFRNAGLGVRVGKWMCERMVKKK